MMWFLTLISHCVNTATAEFKQIVLAKHLRDRHLDLLKEFKMSSVRKPIETSSSCYDSFFSSSFFFVSHRGIENFVILVVSVLTTEYLVL